jgi:hypothetical protein
MAAIFGLRFRSPQQPPTTAPQVMPPDTAPCPGFQTAVRRLACMAVALACWAAAPLWAATLPPLTLEWNPNREKNLAGYELSYGTSRGKHPVTVKTGLETRKTLKGLKAGVTYYFVVRAYNKAGKRSPPSKEISFRGGSQNRAPEALSRFHSTRQGQSLRFRLSGKDPEGAPLTYRIVKRPLHGTLSGKPTALTYRPAKGFTGIDQLTFRVHDGKSSSAIATVRIVVTPDAKPTSGTVTLNGRKYRILTIPKAAIPANRRAVVEVSSDRVKWSSGSGHTVVLTDDAGFLIVRDRTPVTESRIRYIRLKLVRR